MKLSYLALTCGLGISMLLSACGEAPTESDLVESDPSTNLSEAPLPPGSDGLKWSVTHSGQMEPWIQFYEDMFRGAVEDVVSGDPDRAAQGATVLMEFDSNLFPDALRGLTSGADPEIQAYVEEAIEAYWNGPDGLVGSSELRTLGPANGYGESGYSALGPGGEVTFEVDGKITTLPGSKITLNIWGWGSEDISVAGETFTIDTNESPHTCPDLHFKSTNSVEGLVVPVKFTVPGYGPVRSITVDLKLSIDLTFILRYYSCEEEEEEEGQEDDRER